MKAIDPTASVNGDVTIDVWSRKSDYRPAKIAISATSPDMGTFGATFDLKYDVPVSVTPPRPTRSSPRSSLLTAAGLAGGARSPRRGPGSTDPGRSIRRPEGPGEGPRPTMGR